MNHAAHTFDSEPEAREFLRARLSARFENLAGSADIDWRAVAAETHLIATLAAPQPPRPGPVSAPALVRRWVIQDDDLRVLDTVIDTLVALVPASYALATVAPTTLPVAAIATAMGALTRLALRARKKGAVLDPRAFAVLTALRVNGSLSTDALDTLMRSEDDSWTRPELDATLQRLKAYPARDGSPLALVAEHDGAWRPVDV